MRKKLISSPFSVVINTGIALFILRVVAAGLLWYGHGYVKLSHIATGNFHFMDPIGIGAVPSLLLAAFAEGICTIFVFIGYYTRPAAFILMINLTIAYLTMFDEAALLYLLLFTVIFLLGPGKLSFDSVR
jgi:putative oxidoreductase